MIFVRNRLIFGFIRKIITGALKFVYKIISAFNLQLTLLVLLIGFVVYLVGGFENGGVALVIFVIALAFSIFVAVFGTVKRLLGFGKKEKKGKRAQLVGVKEQKVVEQEQTEYQATPSQSAYATPVQTSFAPRVERPVYYRVEQNPEYIMAEYSDRYELYKLSGGQMIKVRTDFKDFNGEIL